MTPEPLAAGLAHAFLAGTWDPDAMAERARDALRLRRDRKPPRWLLNLARAARSAYPVRPADRPRELAEFVAVCPPLTAELSRRRAAGRELPRIRRWAAWTTEMSPVGVEGLPQIDTVGELAAWLGLSVSELDWYADRKSLERQVRDERLRHYRYRIVPKPSGGARLLEAPKPRLAVRQRRVLHEILDRLPQSAAAHEFRQGHSVATFAAPHACAIAVLRMDLEGFFPSIAAGRVFGILHAAGYAEPVAHVLTALVTNTVPAAVRRQLPWPADPQRAGAHSRLLATLSGSHLPQGAPTSPALANLCARTLDRRLTGLAASWERLTPGTPTTSPSRAGRPCTASGSGTSSPESCAPRASGWRRTRPGPAGQTSASCSRGWWSTSAAANRAGHPDFAAHLLGRISWVEAHDPARGRRLREAYDRIVR